MLKERIKIIFLVMAIILFVPFNIWAGYWDLSSDPNGVRNSFYSYGLGYKKQEPLVFKIGDYLVKDIDYSSVKTVVKILLEAKPYYIFGNGNSDNFAINLLVERYPVVRNSKKIIDNYIYRIFYSNKDDSTTLLLETSKGSEKIKKSDMYPDYGIFSVVGESDLKTLIVRTPEGTFKVVCQPDPNEPQEHRYLIEEITDPFKKSPEKIQTYSLDFAK